MRDIVKLGLKLFLLAAVAGLLLGATNAVTAGPIEEQRIAEVTASRQEVLRQAVRFEAVEAGDLDEAFAGFGESGEIIGYTGKTTVQGFGGPIEVTVGLRLDGSIVGVQVGGTGFAETVGLGEKTRYPDFTENFSDHALPVALSKNGGYIDAVTSATISSNAVVGGVNIVGDQLLKLIGEGR